jgi:hypothetical protein
MMVTLKPQKLFFLSNLSNEQFQQHELTIKTLFSQISLRRNRQPRSAPIRARASPRTTRPRPILRPGHRPRRGRTTEACSGHAPPPPEQRQQQQIHQPKPGHQASCDKSYVKTRNKKNLLLI